MRTALIFNGHTSESVDQIDIETMAQIQTMYADGAIGNHGLMKIMSALTCGVFNYIRSENAPAYKVKDILGSVADYIYAPLSDEDIKTSISNGLMAYMQQAPGGAERLGKTNVK